MSSEKVVDIDGVLRLGRYTVFICITAEFLVLSQLGNMFYMAYAGAAPTIKGCGMHKFDSKMSAKEICARIHALGRNETCELDLEYDFKSMNVEFNYLCRDTRFVKNSISIQMIGVVMGALIFGHLSDLRGRKPLLYVFYCRPQTDIHREKFLSVCLSEETLIVCLCGCAVFGLLSAFAKDLQVATIYRTVIGFFNGGQMATLLVYVVEILPKKDRIWITTIICWSPNVVIFALIAYYSENWRRLAIATSLLTAPAILLCIIAYESPRWLIQKGRIDEAQNILQRITRLNGRSDVTNDMIDEVIDREKQISRQKVDSRKDYYIYHLFHTRKLATYTIVLSYSFLAASLVNYGLLFNMEKLSGSIYVNNIFLGFTRYSINIASAVIDYTQEWFGRRVAHTVPLAFIVLGFAINFIVAYSGLTVELETLSRIATLVAFSMSSQVFIISGMAGNELFPTPLRSISYSFLQVVSRVGVVIAPQLFFLADYWTAAPFLALIVFALIDLVLYLAFIPETKGRPLRDRLSLTAVEQQQSQFAKLQLKP